jgi:sugar phosphate isomerase/epimerase
MKKSAFPFILVCCIIHYSFGQQKLLKETPGIVSYCFDSYFRKDVPGTLDKIKAMGITNVEFSNFFGKTPDSLRILLDQRGMRCTSIGIGYADCQNKMESVIKNAKILGAEFVRVASIPHPGNFQDLDAETVKKAAIDFNIFGKKLKENGLQFCYHNHGPEFKPAGALGEGTFYDYLMQNTDPAYVFFEIDVLWVYAPGQDPVALLKKYPDRFKLMHLKDMKKTAVRGVSNPPEVIGSGQIDIEGILRAAQKTAIKYIYIEIEGGSNISNVQIPPSLVYLSGLKK